MKSNERLKAEREKAGLTQAQLANRIGTTYQNISQYERGIRTPRYETMVKIASAIGITANQIWQEELQEETFNKEYGEAIADVSETLKSVVDAFDSVLLQYCSQLSLKNKGKLLSYAADLLDVQTLQEMYPDRSKSKEVDKILS